MLYKKNPKQPYEAKNFQAQFSLNSKNFTKNLPPPSFKKKIFLIVRKFQLKSLIFFNLYYRNTIFYTL